MSQTRGKGGGDKGAGKGGGGNESMSVLSMRENIKHKSQATLVNIISQEFQLKPVINNF